MSEDNPAREAFECMSAALDICRAVSRECGGQMLLTGHMAGTKELIDATSTALGPLAKEFDKTKCVLGKAYPHAVVPVTIALVEWILNKGHEDKQIEFAISLYEKKHGALPPPGDMDNDPGIICTIFEEWLDYLARSPVMCWLKERAQRA